MVLLCVLKYVTHYVCEVTRYVIHVTRNLNYVTRVIFADKSMVCGMIILSVWCNRSFFVNLSKSISGTVPLKCVRPARKRS